MIPGIEFRCGDAKFLVGIPDAIIVGATGKIIAPGTDCLSLLVNDGHHDGRHIIDELGVLVGAAENRYTGTCEKDGVPFRHELGKQLFVAKSRTDLGGIIDRDVPLDVFGQGIGSGIGSLFDN
jgi:hypothetical protein